MSLGLGLLVFALGWNTLFARSSNPTMAKEIFDQTTRRIDDREKTRAADNGYAVLKDLLEQKPVPEKIAPIKNLAAYFDGDREKNEASLRKDEAKTTRDIQVFEAILPRLKEAGERPLFFFTEDWRKGMRLEFPNFVALRSVILALRMYGLHQEMRGKLDNAIPVYLLVLRLGNHAGQTGCLIDQMIALSCQDIALDALTDVIASGKLYRRAYVDVMQQLQGLSWRNTDFCDTIDEEYVLAVQTENRIERGETQYADFEMRDESSTKRLLARFLAPVVASRERTTYENYYLKIRPMLLDLDVERLQAAYAQAVGFYSSPPMMDLSPAILHFMSARTRMGAVQILAALQTFRLDHGTPPASLGALVPSYLMALPRDFMTKDHRFVYRPTGREFTLASDSPLWSQIHYQVPVQFYPYKPLRAASSAP